VWDSVELFESCVKVAVVVILGVTVDHSTETSLSTTNWAIDERELGDVVFVNHS